MRFLPILKGQISFSGISRYFLIFPAFKSSLPLLEFFCSSSKIRPMDSAYLFNIWCAWNHQIRCGIQQGLGVHFRKKQCNSIQKMRCPNNCQMWCFRFSFQPTVIWHIVVLKSISSSALRSLQFEAGSMSPGQCYVAEYQELRVKL